MFNSKHLNSNSQLFKFFFRVYNFSETVSIEYIKWAGKNNDKQSFIPLINYISTNCWVIISNKQEKSSCSEQSIILLILFSFLCFIFPFFSWVVYPIVDCNKWLNPVWYLFFLPIPPSTNFAQFGPFNSDWTYLKLTFRSLYFCESSSYFFLHPPNYPRNLILASHFGTHFHLSFVN